MLETGTILFFSFGYIALLFGIAHYGDKRADQGRSIISNPYIYTLSLAVYCTAWTFYGSVGRAVRSGIGFITIYLGPTLMAALGFLVIRKIIRISKAYRITSIADFISSRYGKSRTLAGLVTIIAVAGIIPYIALQLKAISTSFLLVRQYPHLDRYMSFVEVPVLHDTAFYVALILVLFAILFGTRHLEATERHEGVVAAIAFESVVKLAAFLIIGIYVTFFMFDGPKELFSRAMAMPELNHLITISAEDNAYTDWAVSIFLSMMAILFLPRQFQVTVVENVNERHLSKAIWLFPLYLLIINIFVLPIALSGMLWFPYGTVDADTFVLTLPMAVNQETLALLVFIGGMSAATGMVIVETMALSTMICNDLAMPILLRLPYSKWSEHTDLTRVLLTVRRGSIALVLMLGYAYFRYIGEFYALVSIGIISFAGVAQFAPAMLGGIFWKGGNRAGAFSGLVAGFLMWGYTLVIPTMVQAHILPDSLVSDGLFGITFLRPYALFGLTDLSQVSHGVFWSMLFNISAYIGVSVFTETTTIEHSQAALFVDVFKYAAETKESPLRRGRASVHDLRSLLERFLGKRRTEEVLDGYANAHGLDWDLAPDADAALVNHVEQSLASAIGSASAHVLVGSVLKEEPLTLDEVMSMLDETRQVIIYSRELERATTELKAANERLKELDRLKDDFVSTVTHELRTPLTAIRSIAEILHANPALDESQTRRFSAIVIKESERLTRLIHQVLDVQKIESGRMTWQVSRIHINDVIEEAMNATRSLADEKSIEIVLQSPAFIPMVSADRDRLIQVLVNLISNAVKFCPEKDGRIVIRVAVTGDILQVDVIDNGEGIDEADQEIIFEKFRQVHGTAEGKPGGSGLGLNICRSIIEFHKGRIWVVSEPGQGATFSFTLPLYDSPDIQFPYGM